MTTPLRVALAQINTTVGDFAGNGGQIARAIGRAKAAGAALVVFPELAVTGYPPEDALLQEHFVGTGLETFRSLFPHSKGITAIVGFVDRDKAGRLYNAAAVLENGRLRAVYHKSLLPNYGVFDEKRYFYPGAGPLVITVKGVRIGLTICEDIWQPESFVYQKGFGKRISLLVNISASPYHRGKQTLREALVKKLARRLSAPVVYLNLVGGQDELVFDGGSMVMLPSGAFRSAARFDEDFVIADVPLNGKFSGPLKPAAALSGTEEVYRALVLGTRDYVMKNGFKKAAIGLSGGIDSALVAQIAVDALGPAQVVGVTMPSPFTSAATYRDAKTLARNLGIECLDIPITGIFRSYLKTLKKPFAGRKPDIAEENLQARIRGNLLMALSNKFSYLVLTTGNKSEFATGYCTLYGDMAGGFAVIKDVPKTLVFELARWRNRFGGAIPVSTIRRAPSAELRRGQKDQDTLPPYPVLDRFIEAFVERDAPIASIVQSGFPAALAKIISRMIYLNEYKRRQAPPGVKITPKAFGRDRRMPITNRFLS